MFKNWLRFLFESELSALRSQLAEERRRGDALDVQARLLQSENERLWNRADESIQNERFSLRTQVNTLTQQVYGFKPHADAPGLPTEEDLPAAAQQQNRFVHGADMVRSNRENFRSELQDRVKKGEIPLEQANAVLAAMS